MRNLRGGLLVWIISFKVLKGSALIALGLVLLATRKTIPADDLLGGVAQSLHVPFTSRLLERAMRAAVWLTPQREAIAACTALAYGGLFWVEAVGLWMRVSWARWLTIIATASLIPLECYELAMRITATRVAFLLVNVGVVWYLVRRKEMFHRHA